MGICFVIQPYDKGEFDQRYTDVLSPAITQAGLDPYRVDEDSSTKIVIERIQEKILESSLCLADITSTSPNVWYEVGYAKASGKDIIFICDDSGIELPFDMRHERVDFYKRGAPSYFKEFELKLVERIKNLLSKEVNMKRISISPINEPDGLELHEMLGLAIIMQNRESPESLVSKYMIDKDMEKLGVNKLGTNIALHNLLRKNMVNYKIECDNDGSEHCCYLLERSGEKWLVDNKEKLNFKPDVSFSRQKSVVDDDSDIPF